jgi:histidinol-phosphatase
MNLRPYLEFGVQTAYEAGRLTLGSFGTEAARPEFKADDTPVTVADREAERLILERIAARYPKHAVIGEEYGETASRSTAAREPGSGFARPQETPAAGRTLTATPWLPRVGWS